MNKSIVNTSDSAEFIKNFQSLTSSIAEGVIIANSKEEIIWVNKALEDICGYPLMKLKGKNPKILQGIDTDKKTVGSIRESLKKNEVVNVELINYRPDGTPYWIQLTVTPILNEKKEIVNYIAFEHDVTEKKIYESEIRESEKLYKSLYEKNPAIMLIFDTETFQILEVNETAINTYGYSKEEFTSLTIKDIRPAEDWEKVEKIVKDVKDDFIIQGIWRHYRKNGEIMFVEIKATGILYKGKKATLVIPTDITEKIVRENEVKGLNENLKALNKELSDNLETTNKLNRELKLKEHKLNEAQRTANIGTWEINLNTNEFKCSREIYNIFEFAPEEKLSFQQLQDKVNPDDLKMYIESINKCVTNLKPLNLEYKILLDNNKHKHLVSKGGILIDEAGRPEIFTGITLDITSKRHNEELIASQLKNINIILSSITEPFFVIDRNYNLVYINDVSEKLSGKKREDIIGKNIWDIYKGWDFELEKYHYEKALKENKPSQFETEYEGRVYSVFLYPSEIGLTVSAKDITRSKKDEKSLLEKVNFIEQIGHNIPGAIFQEIITPEGDVITEYLSEGFEKFWGAPVSEVLRNPYIKTKFIHPDDIDEVKKTLAGISDNSKINHKIRYVNRKTGEIFWVRVNAVVHKNADNSYKITGVVIDVSDTEKFYTELEKSNKRYRYVSMAANEVIWEWDLRTNMLELGGNYKKMFGFEFPDDKVNFNFVLRHIYPEDLNTVRNNIKKGLADYENNFRENHYRMIRNDGEIINVCDRSYTLFDSQTNVPIKIIGAIQDVTQKKKDEESIREKAQFIQQVSNNTPGAIFQSVYYNDGTSKLTFASEGFNTLWGIPVEEVIKSPGLRFKPVHHDDIERVTNEINSAVKNLTKLDCKYRFVNQVTNEICWVRSISMPIKQSDGTVVLTGVIIDVSESEKYYEALEKSNERYEYVSKAANESIWDLDMTTQIFTFGGSYKEMFGYELHDDKAGYSEICAMIHPDDRERVLKGVQDTFADSNKRYWEDYYRVINKRGETVYVYDRGYLIYDEKTNKPVRFVGATQNITQRKLDEEALLEQAKKVSIILESMTDPFFVLGKNLEIVMLNNAALALSKFNKNEFIGKALSLMRDKVEHKELFRFFRKSIDEQKAVQQEFEIRGRWFDVHTYPSEIGLSVYAKDITIRKKAEKELIENTKFIKEISESMNGFIFQTEYDTNFSAKLNYASEKAEKYWGVTVKEVMEDQTKLLDSIHFEDIAVVVNKRLESVKNLTLMDIKFRYVNKKTNEIKWVRATAVPTKLDNGNVLVNGAVIDITETENYYNRLEEANRRYEYLSKSTHDTIWEMDLDTYNIVLGGGYREILGEEFPGNTISFDKWKEYVHPDDIRRVINSMEENINILHNKYWENSYRIIRKDGENFEVYERAYIVYDERDSRPVKIIGSTQDITQLKKVQAEREKIMQDLIKRNKALEQFTYIVSHNLRAPVANILGISYLLEDGGNDEETLKEMHGLIKKSSSNLDEIIKDMNDILAAKKGFAEERTEIFFDDIVNEIIERENDVICKSKVAINSDFKNAPTILSVKNDILSIFQNLISNAVKYRRGEQPYVNIKSYENEEYIFIKFEDNGMGMDIEKNKNKIFGLYNKFHTEKNGKGMGLYMVKSSVDNLDGVINVESEIDIGTTFTVKLKK